MEEVPKLYGMHNIVAATVCRFVGDSNWDPQEQLTAILKFRETGHLEQVE